MATKKNIPFILFSYFISGGVRGLNFQTHAKMQTFISRPLSFIIHVFGELVLTKGISVRGWILGVYLGVSGSFCGGNRESPLILVRAGFGMKVIDGGGCYSSDT